MSRRGFSPLERRALLALVSLIRDREPDPEEWLITWVKPEAVYERCAPIDPAGSWYLQRRNRRQSIRRALGRLAEQGYVDALALAWVLVPGEDLYQWQGGGSRQLYKGDTLVDTPRWRRVGLTDVGIKAALLLEQEETEGRVIA